MRRHLLSSVILLTACTGTGPDSDSGGLVGGDTCTVLTSGTWTFTGDAFGMGDIPMDGDVTMDAEACTFTFGNWSMAMDDLPSGGVIDGSAMQLDGLTSKWQTCTGTATDEASASGTCAENDTPWVMVVSTSGGE